MYQLFRTLLAALTLGAGCLAVVGNQSQAGLLDNLFVPLPPSAPVRNAPRHPPPAKQQPIVIVQEEVIRPPDIDWTALYANLPRDSKGTVGWMQALDEKLITLKPGIDPATEPASTLDSEITFVPEGNPGKSAVFRHATHTQWLACKNCHPALFKKRSENLQFTHDDMDAGKYCGACHKKVVVLTGGCKGCHAAKKPAAPAAA
jgi:c(7)-type cytochrome triheme protein